METTMALDNTSFASSISTERGIIMRVRPEWSRAVTVAAGVGAEGVVEGWHDATRL